MPARLLALRLSLRLCQKRVGVADFELAGRFVVQLHDLAILDQHGIAVAAQPQALAGQIKRQAGGLGKGRIAIG